MRSMIAAVALSFAAPLAIAEDTSASEAAATIGPVVGTEAPAFSALSTTGETLDLEGISGTSGAVLVFSRSLDWCPFCKKQALELKAAAEPLAADGWNLNLITYDSAETLFDYASSEMINYALLSDADSKMIDAFGLRNTDITPGSRFDGIPHPAVVFVSKDGVVRAFMREEGYKDRPPVESLTEAAALLNETGLIN